MARHRKHIITRGDTVHGIAQRHTGDPENWTRIIDYNNLKYPYITDSPKKKRERPESLLTIGDTIYVPLSADIGEKVDEEDNTDNVGRSLNNKLGMDLKLSSVYRESGTSDGVFGLVGDGAGDLGVVKGRSNVVQATLLRLNSRLGSLINHETYGSDIHKLIGSKSTVMTQRLLDNEIELTIRKDGRVSNVIKEYSEMVTDGYVGEFTVELQSVDERFKVGFNENSGAYLSS